MLLTLLACLAVVWSVTVAVVVGLCVCAARHDRELASRRRRVRAPRVHVSA